MRKICNCKNSIEGVDRRGQRHWLKTVHEHVDAIKAINQDLDVVFFGDSITEVKG